jgi:hypothetical protein
MYGHFSNLPALHQHRMNELMVQRDQRRRRPPPRRARPRGR